MFGWMMYLKPDTLARIAADLAEQHGTGHLTLGDSLGSTKAQEYAGGWLVACVGRDEATRMIDEAIAR